MAGNGVAALSEDTARILLLVSRPTFACIKSNLDVYGAMIQERDAAKEFSYWNDASPSAKAKAASKIHEASIDANETCRSVIEILRFDSRMTLGKLLTYVAVIFVARIIPFTPFISTQVLYQILFSPLVILLKRWKTAGLFPAILLFVRPTCNL